MIAENTSAIAAPMPTVEPMAFSTGTEENASRPNPITVVTAANANASVLRGRCGASSRSSDERA